MTVVQFRGWAAAGVLVATYALVGALLLPMTTSLLATASGPQAQVGQLVALAAALASCLTLLWAALVTLLPLLAAAAGGTGSLLFQKVSALGPPSVRHLVAALLGVGLMGSAVAAAVPAAATQVNHTTQDTRVTQEAQTAPLASAPHAVRPATDAGTASPQSRLPDLDRPALPAGVAAGWTPDRPVAPHRQSAIHARAAHLVTGSPTPGRQVLDHLVVRRGDSLWDIAARHLGPAASAVEIAREWPRWHLANRAVIGPDPGLLLPGQQLVAPPPR